MVTGGPRKIPKIPGDQDARPPVARLEVFPKPSLAVRTVPAVGQEALAERLRVEEVVRVVQKRH